MAYTIEDIEKIEKSQELVKKFNDCNKNFIEKAIKLGVVVTQEEYEALDKVSECALFTFQNNEAFRKDVESFKRPKHSTLENEAEYSNAMMESLKCASKYSTAMVEKTKLYDEIVHKLTERVEKAEAEAKEKANIALNMQEELDN